jgi:hypothetical protein
MDALAGYGSGSSSSSSGAPPPSSTSKEPVISREEEDKTANKTGAASNTPPTKRRRRWDTPSENDGETEQEVALPVPSLSSQSMIQWEVDHLFIHPKADTSQFPMTESSRSFLEDRLLKQHST